MHPLVDPLLTAAPAPFRRAARAGAAADGVGEAFLAGYRAAVEALVPGVSAGALLATEAGPLRPGAITTALADGRLTGRKSFATGVPGAEQLVVLATTGREGDRLRLVAALVGAADVEILPMPPLPFVPDVPHATVVLSGAPVQRVLPGDGWADVVRPFRTLEDVHVVGAVCGYLLGASARAGFAREAASALAGALAALATLAAAGPSDPAVHLALAGVLADVERAVGALTWTPSPEAERWSRDLPLLRVAAKARAARLEAASARLGFSPAPAPRGATRGP